MEKMSRSRSLEQKTISEMRRNFYYLFKKFAINRKKRIVFVSLAVFVILISFFRHQIYYVYYSYAHAYNVSIFGTIASDRPRAFFSRPKNDNDRDESNQLLSRFRLQSEHKCECRQREIVELAKLSKGQNIYQVKVLIDDQGKVGKSYEMREDEFESSILTCSLFDSLRRGPNQKVVAYSLYGNDSFYYDKLVNLTRIIKEKYPGWTMRVYYDDSTVDPSIICQIECAKMEEQGGQYLDNADLCNINKIPYDLESTWSAGHMHGMMWRWLPIGDSFVDVFSSRDSDSYILDRELASVTKWLQSSTLFHIMRDHKGHNTHILGGLWGFANYKDRQLAKQLFNSMTNPVIANNYNSQRDRKGYDQFFLTDFVWPFAKLNATVHDSYTCLKFPKSAPFPTRRLNPKCFVGSPDACDESGVDDTTAHRLWSSSNSQDFCPIECRPQVHLDWFYC